jgi:hypothetical protein
MIVRLNHPSIVRLLTKDKTTFDFLKNIDNFDQFKANIELVAKNYKKYSYDLVVEKYMIHKNESVDTEFGFKDSKFFSLPQIDQLSIFKIKGDIFEIFSEFFFLNHNTIFNIKTYNIVPSDEDYGVDAYGEKSDGSPFTVQVKYRKNASYALVANDIKLYPFQAIKKYGVKEDSNIYLLTSCNSIEGITCKKSYLNIFKNGNLINNQNIYSLVSRKQFWMDFYNSLMLRFNS